MSEARKAEKRQNLMACISLGSNIEPALNLQKATALLSQATRLLAVSRVWETAAVGSKGPNFLNAAVLVQTDLAPIELKSKVLREIETISGRVRGEDPNAPRQIDLDLIVYDGKVIDSKLWLFSHLAVPVAELLPDLTPPEGGKTLAMISVELAKTTRIGLREDINLEMFQKRSGSAPREMLSRNS